MAKIPTETISELDFNEIRKNFISYVKNNSEFSNYDFEASGLNFVVDLLAYNTQYSAYYLNQLASEMYLDTAQKRKNVVSMAKQMGYLANSKKASQAVISFRLTNTTNFLGPYTLPKNTQFIGRTANDETFPFINIADTNLTSLNVFSENIILYQGVLQKDSILVNNLIMEKKYEIPSTDVDIETLKVYVKDNPNALERKRYYRAVDITLLNSSSEIFYIEQNYDGKYQLVFGDGVLGKEIKNNNVIEIEYIATAGSEGNDCISFDLLNRNTAPTTYSIRATQFSSAGADEEDIESIRINARKLFLSQNRAVTERDYEILLIKYFNYIDTVSVWGGEKNDPPIYGTIYCAVKPKNRAVLTSGEKSEIEEKLNQLNMITIKPVVLDPEYSYVRINADIVYDAEEITSSESVIITDTKNEIKNYVQNNLLKFNRRFHISDISRLIDDLDVNYVATNVDISLYQKRTVDIGVSTYYYINFNNVIKKGSLNATSFDYLDANGNYIRNCYLVENENFDGISVAVNVTVNNVSQQKIIVSNVGSLDYETGVFKLETFAPYLPGDFTEIEFEVIPDTFVITPAREQILTSLDDDIIINPQPFVDRASTAQNITKSGLFRTV